MAKKERLEAVSAILRDLDQPPSARLKDAREPGIELQAQFICKLPRDRTCRMFYRAERYLPARACEHQKRFAADVCYIRSIRHPLIRHRKDSDVPFFLPGGSRPNRTVRIFFSPSFGEHLCSLSIGESISRIRLFIAVYTRPRNNSSRRRRNENILASFFFFLYTEL